MTQPSAVLESGNPTRNSEKLEIEFLTNLKDKLSNHKLALQRAQTTGNSICREFLMKFSFKNIIITDCKLVYVL